MQPTQLVYSYNPFTTAPAARLLQLCAPLMQPLSARGLRELPLQISLPRGRIGRCVPPFQDSTAAPMIDNIAIGHGWFMSGRG